MKKINSKKLLDLIFERQISNKELAKQAGISTGAVSSLLRRGARAQLVTIAKLARALNISPYELMIDDETV